MDRDDDSDEEDIEIDFSKIKNFFKGKSEKQKVVEIQEKAEIVQEKIEGSAEDTKKDLRELKNIKSELDKEENEARIIDSEKVLIDKKIDLQEKRIDEISEDSDEISYDFTKIKNFFTGLFDKKSRNREAKTNFGDHFTKYRKFYILALILLPLLLSVNLRVTPIYLPLTEDWASSTVYGNVREQIRGQVRSQYPTLPEANLNNIINQQIAQFETQNQGQIENQIGEAVSYYKSRLQKDGQTYLIAIDPYFWMRHAKNILERGSPGDEFRNPITNEICTVKGSDCADWDNHMYAPIGRQIPRDMFHAYFTAYVHKFISIFNPDQDLMSTAFIIPIIIASLSVIPAFFITRRIAGNFAGFVAGLVVAIHPAFLTRTIGGFSDTDAYNVLFPLLITWFFLEAFQTRDIKKTLIYTAISSLFVAIYTTAWGGWWYIFDFLLVSLIVYLGVFILIHRDEIKTIFTNSTFKHSGLVFSSFFIFSMILTFIISEPYIFWGAFRGPGGFLSLKEVGISVWPNVFTTVAEQNSASLNNVISQIGIGSILLFLLALIGIALTLIKKNSTDKIDLIYFVVAAIWFIVILNSKPQNLLLFLGLISLPIIIRIIIMIIRKEKDLDIKPAIILIVWFLSTTFASTKGIRFMLILVPAFSIGLGIGLGTIHSYISKYTSKILDLKKGLIKTVFAVLLLLLLMNPFQIAKATAQSEIPSMNDAWFESLDKINRESAPDAIINSWWDFGHWFKFFGDRAVTFDGTSQGTPMAHWIGHTLLTNDEDKAIGLLRMLDCGSNTAFEKLDEDIKDITNSVEILHDVVLLNKEDAKDLLLEFVNEDKADEVLLYTHCDPPENYYITSDDMIGKSGVWAHFGIWNFERAMIYSTLKNELEEDQDLSIQFIKDRFGYSDSEAQGLYFEVKSIKSSTQANSWIAPWPSYASSVTNCATNENNTILCQIPANQNTRVTLRINLEDKTADIDNIGGTLHPNSVVYPTEEGMEKFTYQNNTIGFEITLIPNGDSYSYIMSAPPLADSIFTKLYFLDGHGLTKFKKFSDQRSILGQRIVVWKVDWEGNEKNEIYFNDPIAVDGAILDVGNATAIDSNDPIAQDNAPSQAVHQPMG